MQLFEFRFEPSVQPLTSTWMHMPIAPRGSTLLGLSFRPRQAAAFGLDIHATLQALLPYPFQLIRLGAYWDQMESGPGRFQTEELDWQVDAAEQAGKQIILCLGPLKTFGYPEFFVPAHHYKHRFREGTRVKPAEYSSLLETATAHLSRLVEHYKERKSIVAWQLEHEAVDPLGVEHSWRLAAGFVEQEAKALRKSDPSRPVMMNGFLPTSLLVRFSQGWRTRDQGDSLALSQRLADMVGIDYYPRLALASVGTHTLYLDGSQSGWQRRKRKELFAWARAHSQPLLVAEGQAEPWETATTPPSPKYKGMYSCLPEQLIINYNTWQKEAEDHGSLYAYLFWGAEYWILRTQDADPSYLQTFVRILENS